MATVPAFNPNAAYSAPAFNPNAAYEAGPKAAGPSAPDLTANPKGQGTYSMWDNAGQMHAIPYSLVPVARGQGFTFDSNPVQDANNPSRNGLTPMQQFTKDESADPNRIGGTSLQLAPAGARWTGVPEPDSRQESLQRLAQAETDAPLPMRVATGAMKGAGTLERPVIDAINMAKGANGNTPQEQSEMLAARTPAETAAKVATVGAGMAPAVMAAPVATALGLGAGSVAGYGANKAANAMGIDPKTGAVIGDVAGLAAGAGAAGMEPVPALGAAAEEIAPHPVNYVRRGASVDYEATLSSLPKVARGFTRLFRSASPTTKFEDVFDLQGLADFNKDRPAGESYTPDLPYADYYRESYGRDASTHYIDVPDAVANSSQISPGEHVLGTGSLSGVRGAVSLPNRLVGGATQFMPEAVRNGSLPSAWNWAKNDVAGPALAGDVNAPIPGTEPPLTPAARYESMKSMGMQPNAAEATNSPLLKGAQWLNEDSLTSAGRYANARAKNLRALNDYVGDVLGKMSSKSPEEGGAAVQQGLRTAQVNLQNQAAQGYLNLDRQVGARELPGAGLQQTAKFLHDQNVDYYTKHPELVPTNAWKIVKDLAGADTTPPFQARPMSFGEVHQLRSDLLEIVRTNPDIVKNQAGGWLQKLAEAADDTMTNGGKGMTPQQLAVYRNANEAWANMKNTYDNPQSQIYHAVRSASPSTLVNGIAQTPEMAKTLQSALGPDGMGPIQRGMAEKLLGSTKEGGYNLKTFQGKWNKIDDGYKNALFTPGQIEALDNVGNAGTVLHEDVNPSGSAKQGQKVGEMLEAASSLGHPALMAKSGAYHATQYGLGRLMNSPGFVDWLMRGRGFAPVGEAAPTAGSRLVPAAVAGGALPSAWDWEKNEPKH